MSKDKNVPEIRFDGFEDEWKIFNLKELGNFKNGMNFSKDAMGIGFPFVNLQNIFGKNIIEAENLDKALASNQQLKDYSLNKGDVLFVRSSVKLEGVGEAALVSDNLKDTTYSGFIIRFRDIYGLENNFKRFVFSTKSVRKQIISQSTNSANKNISQSVLEKLKVSIPEKNEQEKVGDFFSNLDNLIFLQKQKYEKLLDLKKAMLNKLFPKEGETAPEIRFDGFSGEWEENVLGKIMEVTSVKRIHQKDWVKSGIPFLRARDIVARSKNISINDPIFITEDKYIECISISGRVKIGDLLVTGVGTIGVPMLIQNSQPIYFKDGNVIWFKNKNNIDPKFLYYSFYGNLIQKYIKISSGIGTVGTYTIESGKQTPIKIPSSRDEQKAIGDYFSKLDKLIELNKEKLDKLKNVKSSLFDNMFV